MTWLLVMTSGPGTPSIWTITPDPDSSVGLVLPGAGGLTASTETTLGAVCRMTASNRSPSCIGDSPAGSAAGGAGRPDWATTGSVRLSRRVPARPPVNAQLPKARALTNRCIGGVAARVSDVGTSLRASPHKQGAGP